MSSWERCKCPRRLVNRPAPVAQHRAAGDVADGVGICQNGVRRCQNGVRGCQKLAGVGVRDMLGHVMEVEGAWQCCSIILLKTVAASEFRGVSQATV